MSIKPKISLLFIVLIVFVLLRPIISIRFFATHGIFGNNILELFGLGISYTLTIFLFLNLNKVRFDSVMFFILALSLYSILSLFWGSTIEEVMKFILPVSVFFTMRTIVDDEKHIKVLFLLVIISFIFPVIGSSWLIVQGKGLGMTVYRTGNDRNTIRVCCTLVFNQVRLGVRSGCVIYVTCYVFVLYIIFINLVQELSLSDFFC